MVGKVVVVEVVAVEVKLIVVEDVTLEVEVVLE